MNASIQIFNNEKFGEVRVTEIEGKTYFVGSDVAKALGYANPSEAIATHCKSSNIVKRYIAHETGNGGVYVNFVSEGDIYRLAAKSQLPGAEAFESWIFDEVLPSVSKHGGYITPQKIEEALLNPDTLIRLAQNLKDEQQKRIAAETNAFQMQEIIEIKNSEIKELEPDAKYARDTLKSISTFTTTQIAKELGMSAVTLNKKLRDYGIQYKVNDQWVLYAKYHGKGFVETSTYTEIKDGISKTYHLTVWTELGRKFILGLFKKDEAA